MEGGVRRLGRVGCGLAMMVAPLLLLVSSALGPPHRASRHLADPLPHIAADPDRFLASVFVGLLSLALLLPAVLGIAHLLLPGRPALALTGAALVLVGVLSLAVVHGVQLAQHQMVHTTADRDQMVALLQRLEGGIGLKVIFVGFFLGLFVGWVILSVGLFTARVVPRAIPVSVLISLLLNFFGLELLSRLFFLLGLGWLGVVVVSMRDDAWVLAESDGAERST